MKPTNDGGPAFPFPTMEQGSTCTAGAWAASPGMTLRDYFAAHAPAMPSDLGRLALEDADVDNPDKTHGEKCDVLLSIVSEWRYRYADAMLKAREGGAS